VEVEGVVVNGLYNGFTDPNGCFQRIGTDARMGATDGNGGTDVFNGWERRHGWGQRMGTEARMEGNGLPSA